MSAANLSLATAGKRRNGANAEATLAIPAAFLIVALLVLSTLVPLGAASTPRTIGDTKLSPSAQTNITILPLARATNISSAFWGINVVPTLPFNVSEASQLATTPVTYIRYPGGNPTEQLNYTSGNITNNNGSVSRAVNNASNFVASCEAIGCHAILGLPAEIDSPATAAYYVNYVEHTLNFTPNYWEIGNEPSAWKHFDQPWKNWSNLTTRTVTTAQFTALLLNYTAALRAVDNKTPIIAPALGQGYPNGTITCLKWCGPVVAADGANLSAVSVHSYVAYPPPKDTSLASYFSRLGTSPFALPTVVPKDRAVIAKSYSGSLPLFVDEVGVVNSFNGSQKVFGDYTKQLYGGLFQAAEVTQFLALNVSNVDWFDWASTAGFGWYGSGSGPWSPIGRVFQTFMTQLYGEYDNTTVLGPSTLYAAATTDGTNLSLLVVNVNTTGSFSFPLSTLFSGAVNETSWAEGSNITVNSTAANTNATAVHLSVNVWRGHGYVAPPTKYPITFLESGLPSGVTWNVSVNSVPESLTTDGNTDALEWPGLTNGNYSYSITAISGWYQGTLGYSGSVVVSGGSVTEPTVAYSAVTYLATFTESGLPSKTSWSVTLNGNLVSSTGTSISFAEPNGTYSYSVGSVSGYTSSPSSGPLAVNGGPTGVTITLTATALAITVSPTQGPVGSTVTVSGTGFAASMKVKSLVFDSKTITSCTRGSLTASAAGTFSCTFKVPSGVSGTTVKATNVGGKTATAKFTVTTPRITVNPTSGKVGSTVTVSGTGFSMLTKLKSLVFDSKTITSCTSGSLTTSATGSFSCTFKVPSGTSGTTVKATDVGGQAATARFTVANVVGAVTLTIPSDATTNFLGCRPGTSLGS